VVLQKKPETNEKKPDTFLKSVKETGKIGKGKKAGGGRRQVTSGGF